MSESAAFSVDCVSTVCMELSRPDMQVANGQQGVSALLVDPCPAGLRLLASYRDLWCIRIGDYRVVFPITVTALSAFALRITHRRRFCRRTSSTPTTQQADL